jgi:hypothetical protein
MPVTVRRPAFTLNAAAVEQQLQRARTASAAAVARCLARAHQGTELDPGEMAVLWFAAHVETEELYDAARVRHGEQSRHLETFSPLYMTNTCDAACRMCGMRRDNGALTRQTAPIPAVIEQLHILNRRGMYAVALLTGEYRTANRPWALAYVNEVLRATQALRFKHVLLNVGSIDEPEFATLLAGVARNADGAIQPKLTMCTFQETDSRPLYAKFMGTDSTNPRAPASTAG